MNNLISIFIQVIRFEKKFLELATEHFITREFARLCATVAADVMYSSNIMDLAHELRDFDQIEKNVESKAKMFSKFLKKELEHQGVMGVAKRFNNVVEKGNEEGIEEEETP